MWGFFFALKFVIILKPVIINFNKFIHNKGNIIMSETKKDLIVLETIETTSVTVVQNGLQSVMVALQEAVAPEITKLDAMDINQESTRKARNSLAKKVGSSKVAIQKALKEKIAEMEVDVKAYKAALKQFVTDVDAISASIKAPVAEWKAAEEARVAAHEEKLAEIEKFRTNIEDGGVIAPTLSLSIIDKLRDKLVALEIADDEYLASDLRQKKIVVLDWLDEFKKTRELEISEANRKVFEEKIAEIRAYSKPFSEGGKLLDNMSCSNLQQLKKQLEAKLVNQDEFGFLLESAKEAKEYGLSKINSLIEQASLAEQKNTASQAVVDLLDKIKNISSNLQSAHSIDHARELLQEMKKQKEFLLSVQPSEYGDSDITIQSEIAKALKVLEEHYSLILNQGKQFSEEKKRQAAIELLERLSYVPILTVDNVNQAIESIHNHKDDLLIITDQVKNRLSHLNSQLTQAKIESAEKTKAEREAIEKAKAEKVAGLSKESANKLYKSITNQLVAKLNGCDEVKAKAASWVICKLFLDNVKIDGITLELD